MRRTGDKNHKSFFLSLSHLILSPFPSLSLLFPATSFMLAFLSTAFDFSGPSVSVLRLAPSPLPSPAAAAEAVSASVQIGAIALMAADRVPARGRSHPRAPQHVLGGWGRCEGERENEKN